MEHVYTPVCSAEQGRAVLRWCVQTRRLHVSNSDNDIGLLTGMTDRQGLTSAFKGGDAGGLPKVLRTETRNPAEWIVDAGAGAGRASHAIHSKPPWFTEVLYSVHSLPMPPVIIAAGPALRHLVLGMEPRSGGGKRE
jgi:hypothetical protein